MGSDRPLIPNPAPVSVARFTFRSELPLFPNVTVCVLVVPTGMLLKFNDAGEIVSTGCMPVPFSEIASGVFAASLVTVNVPVTAPVVVGAN